MTAPFFSIVIPTFRRPALLEAAVRSALAQTFADFEVVVSDDDVAGAESAPRTPPLDGSDPRVRVVPNPTDHGQAGNTNNGIRHARGRWIKLLHDDDLLHPACLERIHSTLRRLPSGSHVGVVSCRSDTIMLSGDVRRWQRRRNQPVVELIPSRHTVLAMYLQEDVGESLPTSMCIDRERLVANGAWMPQRAGFVSVVDTHWAILLAALGDRLVINEALVAKRQEPDSVTGRMTDEMLDREFEAIRELQFEAIPADLHPPPLHVTQQALSLRRAAHRLLKRRRPLDALSLAARAWHPRAWMMAVKMPLARRFPRICGRTPRIAMHEP